MVECTFKGKCYKEPHQNKWVILFYMDDLIRYSAVHMTETMLAEL